MAGYCCGDVPDFPHPLPAMDDKVATVTAKTLHSQCRAAEIALAATLLPVR